MSALSSSLSSAFLRRQPNTLASLVLQVTEYRALASLILTTQVGLLAQSKLLQSQHVYMFTVQPLQMVGYVDKHARYDVLHWLKAKYGHRVYY